MIDSWIWIFIRFNNFQHDCSALQFLSPEEQVGVNTTVHNSVAFSTRLRTPGFHYTGCSMYLKFLLAVAYICWCYKACFVLFQSGPRNLKAFLRSLCISSVCLSVLTKLLAPMLSLIRTEWCVLGNDSHMLS